VVLTIFLTVTAIWAIVQFRQYGPAHRIVLASGPDFVAYHRYAQRYIEILRREGVTVEERKTDGAFDNIQLLLNPYSGVDVAFVQAGVAPSPPSDRLLMLASLYYEPVWIFYRDPATLTRMSELRGKSIAVGTAGSGTRVLAEQMLAANGVLNNNGSGADNTRSNNTRFVEIGGGDAVAALHAGSVDAAIFVDREKSPQIQSALRDSSIKLLSLDDADAYPRKFTYITKLALPSGTIDLAANLPDREIQMIATKAMLAAREDFPPALINLLIDAAREIHGGQGTFEAAGEFPNTAQVDLRVSSEADQHRRFGPSVLYRYLPFRIATLVERLIIFLIPLLVVVVPVASVLPRLVRWRVRSRIYRWYGELAHLEREVAARKDKPLPVGKWLQEIDRIQVGVESLKVPASAIGEAYTLRQHIASVRSLIQGKHDAGALESGVS
jgi:TRAP-type uncharacterized transport system substrate-binding protein